MPQTFAPHLPGLPPLVYVVDDEPSVRRTVRQLIESAGYRVIECSGVEQFEREFQPRVPGCLVVDHHLRGLTGLELIERLAAERRNLPVVLITGFATTDTVVRAMRAGAVQVLDKPFDSSRLLQAVRDALQRDTMARQQREQTEQLDARFQQLTERERQVLCLLVEGQMNKNISKRLAISVRAVEQRRRQIFQKTATSSVAELVAAVLELRHLGRDVLTRSAKYSPRGDADA